MEHIWEIYENIIGNILYGKYTGHMWKIYGKYVGIYMGQSMHRLAHTW